MEKQTRNLIQKATQDARKLLESEFGEQLEGIFDILPDGHIASSPGEHLDARERIIREKIVAAIEHEKAGGISDVEGVAHYLRETAFTCLNRFVALKMLEARELVQECVSKGEQSSGFREFCGLAPGLAELPDKGYRLYIESLFDELSTEIRVLFDRRDLASLLWPGQKAFEGLLDILNREEIAGVWVEDETIGWVYQYFNSGEERKKMRDESAVPRNSRELAVRNQFFTPRYVVEFLTDNTLGRIWYEMRQGDTVLKDGCRYLVRRSNEVFLEPGEKAPDEDDGNTDLSQEELLKKTVYIEHRPKKDPRDIKILDPACGSGHFLLYAFDLLEKIYEEAWADEESPSFEGTGRSLREDYQSLENLQRDIPKLIIEHNLHGIDIDHRAVQIAALSLWMRAQRSWKQLSLKPDERPQINRSNIVTAEPMPGEEDMRREFIAGLNPRLLGQLVGEMFKKMELAGEAGALLKIEEKIREKVAEAKRQWLEAPEPEQQSLFPGMCPPKPKQLEFRFDVGSVKEKDFWEKAEERILDALKNYAESVENGQAVRRRLFAKDAATGFAFIDLCRKLYDVVLMNPPFGEFSKPYKVYSRIAYPNSYNDILGAFIERWFYRLEHIGRLGAITSRTCFFLASFTHWREKVILKETALAAVADLGQGVMDNAMVEAAAYVLERSQPKAMIPFIRAIAEQNREAIVRNTISIINSGISERHLFLARQDSFKKLPNAPFVYWVEPVDLDRFAAMPTFEPKAGKVRAGLQTGDDPRFVRTVWEVAPQDTQFVYYPTNGEIFCRLDDPIVLSYFRRRHTGTPRWAFHVKSGASQPWYSPITLKLNYQSDGFELRNFRDVKGKPRAFLRSQLFYYRPGFSWTRRAVRFYPYVVPGNCIPSVSRYMAFPRHGREYDALGVSASRIASAFMRFYGEKFEWPNFLVENLKVLPWPKLKEDEQRFFRKLIQREVEKRRKAYLNHEPFQDFLLPHKVRDYSIAGQSLAFEPKSLLGEAGEQLVNEAFGFDRTAAARIERDVIEALELQHGSKLLGKDSETENIDKDSNEDDDFILDYSDRTQFGALLSYCVGSMFGRWDIRIALDPSIAPKLSEPFDPLPVCPPGMLVCRNGLPAQPNQIVSEECLRARPDANTIPPEGSVQNPTIPDSEYPIRISWDGILVDDPGFNGGQLHNEDIIRRTREVLNVLWKDKAQNIEQEACDILGIPDLRTYFRKNFFPDHIKRYSKSRRKAPIYWQLSTPSASYSVWLYYHRFTKDTFYKVLNEFVTPKLQFEERELTSTRQQYGQSPTASQRKEIAARETFVAELTTFKEEVARIAPLWNPNLNDGVIINFAPLWRLVSQNKPWQRECKKIWDKLVKGDYDWAHLAMHLWPERVVPKCTQDRSLAIAHELDETLWEEDKKGKWHPRKITKETLEALIQERTSITVKAALEELVNAPVPAGATRKKRKRKT